MVVRSLLVMLVVRLVVAWRVLTRPVGIGGSCAGNKIRVKDIHSDPMPVSSPRVEGPSQVVEAIKPIKVGRGSGTHVCSQMWMKSSVWVVA